MSPHTSPAQLRPPRSQRWLRLTSTCAADISREAAEYVWRSLAGVEAAVFRCIDGPRWLVPAGKRHLSVALHFYSDEEPPASGLQDFRGWCSIDVPVHLTTVAELPCADLTGVMHGHVIDALTSPMLVHVLGRPPLHPGHGPLSTQLDRYRRADSSIVSV
jgi:hypothetical protein